LTAALTARCAMPISAPTNIFGFAVPTSLPGVEPHISTRSRPGPTSSSFDKTARALVGMFQKNFAKFEAQVDAEVRAAAPEVKLAAE